MFGSLQIHQTLLVRFHRFPELKLKRCAVASNALNISDSVVQGLVPAWCRVASLTLKPQYPHAYSPHCSPYNSYVTSLENLIKLQHISCLVIISFILMICKRGPEHGGRGFEAKRFNPSSFDSRDTYHLDSV